MECIVREGRMNGVVEYDMTGMRLKSQSTNMKTSGLAPGTSVCKSKFPWPGFSQYLLRWFLCESLLVFFNLQIKISLLTNFGTFAIRFIIGHSPY